MISRKRENLIDRGFKLANALQHFETRQSIKYMFTSMYREQVYLHQAF
jgi:hypothetical protein